MGFKQIRVSYSTREYGFYADYAISRLEEVVYKEDDVQVKVSEFPDTVQAYLNNIVFPKSLDEVYFYATEHGSYNVEDILNEDVTTWTVPNWTKVGDIVLFMHSKTSISTITALMTELENSKSLYSSKEYKILKEWLDRGRNLYKQYGGKIYALGRVIGAPAYVANDNPEYEDTSLYHWQGKIYADIELFVLEKPVDISEFNDFIYVSRQGAITGVWGNEFDKLRNIICLKNTIPDYYITRQSCSVPISQITKENWLNIGNDYRRCFMLEAQFRSFYVNFLLRDIGDQKRIFSECMCKKQGVPNTFADNVILIGGKYLPVEVKLSVPSQSNMNRQAAQYCNTDSIVIDRKTGRRVTASKLYNDNVLVIDTDTIYLYDFRTDSLNKVMDLDNITNPDLLEALRKDIITKLN